MSTSAKTTYKGQGIVPVYDPGDDLVIQDVKLPAGVSLVAGTILGQVTVASATNDAQTVTINGSPTGGTFVLVFAGQVTAAIAYNATSATVQAALEALSTIGAGNVAVSGSAGGPYTCTFQAACAALDQPDLTHIDSLTGGSSPNVSIVHTTHGNPGGMYCKTYASGNSDGSQTPVAILMYDVVVDTFGNMTWGGGDYGEVHPAAPAYFTGTFRCSELTGIDSNAVTKLGRLVSGDTSHLTSATTLLRLS